MLFLLLEPFEAFLLQLFLLSVQLIIQKKNHLQVCPPVLMSKIIVLYLDVTYPQFVYICDYRCNVLAKPAGVGF